MLLRVRRRRNASLETGRVTVIEYVRVVCPSSAVTSTVMTLLPALRAIVAFFSISAPLCLATQVASEWLGVAVTCVCVAPLYSCTVYWRVSESNVPKSILRFLRARSLRVASVDCCWPKTMDRPSDVQSPVMAAKTAKTIAILIGLAIWAILYTVAARNHSAEILLLEGSKNWITEGI